MPARIFRSATPLGVAVALAVLVSCATPSGRHLPPAPGHGPLTTYSVILRHFGDRDSHAIMRVMADEFPGYRSHDLIDKTAETRRYEYRTTAKAFKLEEWLYVLLRDYGFDVEREILIRVQPGDVQVERLDPPSPAPPPQDSDPGDDAGDDAPAAQPEKGDWVPVTGDRFR